MLILSLSLNLSYDITGPLGKVELYRMQYNWCSYNYNSLERPRKWI